MWLRMKLLNPMSERAAILKVAVASQLPVLAQLRLVLSPEILGIIHLLLIFIQSLVNVVVLIEVRIIDYTFRLSRQILFANG